MILSHKKCAFFQNPEYEQSDTIFKHLPILLFSLNHKWAICAWFCLQDAKNKQEPLQQS